MTPFYLNYVALCAKKKKSLSAVAEDIGLSRTSPNGWKKGKHPSEVTLEKLSQYFGVPVEQLLETGQKEKADPPKGTGFKPTKEDWEQAIDNMSQDERRIVMDMLMKKFMEGGT